MEVFMRDTKRGIVPNLSVGLNLSLASRLREPVLPNNKI